MKHPKINVLITIFNAEKYIKKCIQSLIDQSYKNWEAIIIDDKSTDKSIKIIKNNFKDKRLKITKLKKKIGRLKAINLGISKCKADYVAILDADDIAAPERFKKQIKTFKNKKHIKLLASWCNFIDKNNNEIGPYRPPININLEMKKILSFFNPISFSTVMFSLKYAKKIKSIPFTLEYGLDYMFYLKTLKYSSKSIYIIPEYLGSSRISENSLTYLPANKYLVVKDDLNCLEYTFKNFNLSYLQKVKYFIFKLKYKIKLLLI